MIISHNSGAETALLYWQRRAQTSLDAQDVSQDPPQAVPQAMPWDAIEAGVDIVEIDRIGDLARRYGDRFRRRVYTEREWADAGGRADSLAARFAAKEATIKALGSREPALREIEVVRPAWSKPRLRLWGRAAEIAREQAVRQIALSLSHAQQHAVAVVVLVRAGEAVSWDGAVLEAAALAAGRSGLGSDSPGPGHADGRAGDR